MEADPPLVVDSNAVLTYSIALERFQAIPRRHTQSIEGRRRVQQMQLPIRHFVYSRIDAFRTFTQPDQLGVAVAERSDHKLSIAHLTHCVNNAIR